LSQVFIWDEGGYRPIQSQVQDCGEKWLVPMCPFNDSLGFALIIETVLCILAGKAVLGSGSYGTVYYAVEFATNRKVAVKVRTAVDVGSHKSC
jgi:hypothetical protein